MKDELFTNKQAAGHFRTSFRAMKNEAKAQLFELKTWNHLQELGELVGLILKNETVWKIELTVEDNALSYAVWGDLPEARKVDLESFLEYIFLEIRALNPSTSHCIVSTWNFVESSKRAA